MLEGLDKVEWHKYKYNHSYGSATHLPNLIRKIGDTTTEKETYRLCRELRESINHQDDIYEVTVLAIPFIVELILSETVNFRHIIIDWILVLIIDSYVPSLTDHFIRVVLPKTPELQDRFRSKGIYPDTYPYGKSREISRVTRAYLATKKPYFQYVKLLKSSDENLRSEIGKLLSYFYEYREQTYYELMQAIEVEKQSHVKQRLLESLVNLINSYFSYTTYLETDSLLITVNDRNEHGATRLFAGRVYTSTSRQSNKSIDNLIISALIYPKAYFIPKDEYDENAGNRTISGWVAGDIYKLMDDFFHDKILIDKMKHFTWHHRCDERWKALTIALLSHVFLENDTMLINQELNTEQKYVIAVLLNAIDFWDKDIDRSYLQHYGLPTEYDSLLHLLKLSL